MTQSSRFRRLCTLVLLASLTAPGATGQPPVSTDPLPPDYPGFTILTDDGPAPGLLFLSAVSAGPPPYTYLTISESTMLPVNYRRRPGSISDFKLQPNGMLTFFDNTTNCYYAMDASLAVVDSFRCGHGYKTDGHDIQLTTEGHAFLMGMDVRVMDLSGVVPGGQPAASVVGAIVQELDAAKNVVFEWKSLDFMPVTDATHENLTANSIDYMHVNSIAIDLDGNLLLSSRHLDEVTKIDRSTGAIIWRLGGKHNQFTFINDTAQFSHQHDVRRLPDGHLTLFDNGNFHTPPSSRAAEYALDEQKMTATLVWEYRHAPDIYARATGSVQRLTNGNTLISWGTENRISEVRPDGGMAFEVLLGSKFIVYRAFKFSWPLTGIAENVVVPRAPVLFPAYPNPFNPSTKIQLTIVNRLLTIVRVYDILGREISTLMNEVKDPGTYTVEFDPRLTGGQARLTGGHLASGVYFYTLTAGDYVETRKMVLMR